MPTIQDDKPEQPARISTLLHRWGVETHGISPVQEEDRVDPRNYQHFILWSSANISLPTMTIGAGGPVVFALSLRNAAIIILLGDALANIIPAYFALFGPKLGTRAMVQARYSWGYYAVVIPSVLNIIGMLGYVVFSLISGGQMLATVSAHLTPDTGIVVIALVSLAASFCGYKTLHRFESVAWIPTLLGIVVMLGLGGRQLTTTSSRILPPPSVAAILSFTGTVMAANWAWCTMTPDYGVYHNGEASGWLIFTYIYSALFLSSASLHLLGAAFASVAMSGTIPSWSTGYENGNNFGGLVSVILAPSKGFGKLLMVVMSLALAAPTALTMYSFGMSLMNVSGQFARVPRYIFAVIATAICIPLSIAGEKRFYDVLVAVIDFIGYWAASFSGVILMEHILFRGAVFKFSSSSRVSRGYDVALWNVPHALPPGLAALVAFLLSFAAVIPCMAQSFYVGSIAALFGKNGGDIGLLVGFFTACLSYPAMRWLEKRAFPGR